MVAGMAEAALPGSGRRGGDHGGRSLVPGSGAEDDDGPWWVSGQPRPSWDGALEPRRREPAAAPSLPELSSALEPSGSSPRPGGKGGALTPPPPSGSRAGVGEGRQQLRAKRRQL